MFIYFPTTTPSSDKCIWIAYNNIDRYVREDGFTKIYFDGGKEINIDVSYATIDNQITKCIKIEKNIFDVL
ncbi:MAG: competence protein ComK [Bacilli bacterium]|nr:MAG: competence protein ComK [Bacilli bacterium]